MDALALVTDLTTSNATATERAIEKIFAEGDKPSTKRMRWKVFLENVQDPQRELLVQARAISHSEERSQNHLMNAVQRRDDVERKLVAERKESENDALPPPPTPTTTVEPVFDFLEHAPHKENVLS